MPSRTLTFRRALPAILAQVDRLYVYFDKHDAVPEFVGRFPKVVALLPQRFGELGCDGKFLGCNLHEEPCLYFCFDDDILYPPGYVEMTASALERYQLRAIVGFHASRFSPPHLSYREHRTMLHFSRALKMDTPVDELGTGTLGFYTGCFRPKPDSWKHHTMADLMVAIAAVEERIPKIAIRRPANFVTAFEEMQADSLYQRLLKDDTTESEIMRSALRRFPDAWSRTFARRDQRGQTPAIAPAEQS